MRYTIIDGNLYTVKSCYRCPFYDNGDDTYGCHCQYPVNPSSIVESDDFHPYLEKIADDCPLKIQDTHYYQNDGTLKIDYTYPTSTTVSLNELNKKE